MLGGIAFVLGSGYLWNQLTPDAAKNVPIIGDVLSTAANFAKVVGKDGKDTSSSSSSTGDQLMSQVSSLREEIRRALREREDVTVIDNTSGSGAYTITAVVVAGLVGYAYIRWKGWKIRDFMWVTKHGLNDACNVVGNQLNEVTETVHVTKKHLAGRIDRVDVTLDETQQIIEGTRDEVAVIHVNLSSFQKELQEVNRTVEIWGSRLCCIEDTQDRTVRATEALVGFSQQMEHGQSNNFRQISSFVPAPDKIFRRLPPPPPLALETSSSEAESVSTLDETLLAKVVGKDGSSLSSRDQLMSQVSSLGEEIRRGIHKREQYVTVIKNSSGSGAYTITAVVVAGLIGCAFVRWKVPKKQLAGRINRVEATLGETQYTIKETRNEVAVIHVNLSSFQKELQEVNRIVEIWLPPPSLLALETISSAAESEPTVDETQEKHKALPPSE
ncbi:hypothetical protein QYE76_010239 [Lolium multiflorum]|uniref:DUF1664 domain-containing protein n=1 Tax=Lolium multiflorum TaxID=4521 RepID=A0AAD8X454_LOLMU|nr:hypothetical protein QYE76_010239 [Lolium multiflorum]